MLTIRNEQLRALEQAGYETFLWDLVSQAKRDLPHCTAGKTDESLFETISWAAGKAPAYGFIVKESIRRFAYLVLAHGRDYENRADLAWFVEVLRDRRLVGIQKLDRIEELSQRGAGR